MEPVKIVTDSAADVPAPLAEELGITIVPLVIRFGEEAFDETTLSHEAFWEKVRQSGFAPYTSQPGMGTFQKVFRRLVQAGNRALYITVTGRHSGTFSTAWSAAQEFGDRVRVFDSGSLSLGQGWQAIQAARLALKGETMERILGAVESIKRRTRVFIQIETLGNLRRGGRAAKLMPTIDRFMKVLNLRPLLHIEEGELKLLGMARSTSKGIKKIAEEVASLGPLEFIAVMHIRCQNAAEQLAEEIARLVHIPREEIWLGEAGAVLACHGGEGTLGAIAVVAE